MYVFVSHVDTYVTRIYIIYVCIFSLPMCWHTCAGNKGFVSYTSLSMIQRGYTHTYADMQAYGAAVAVM